MSEKIEVKVKHSQSGEHAAHAKEHLKKAEAAHAEKAAEHSSSHKRHETEAARHEVHEQAISGAEYEQPSSENTQHTAYHTKQDKAHSFTATMHHVRRSMKGPEKQFSKFIHQPVVEKTSEVLGKTVARPSGMIGATVAAFLGLFLVYSIAKFAGFELSGSEMPLLLVTGFAIGLFVEWVYKSARSLTAKRSR